MSNQKIVALALSSALLLAAAPAFADHGRHNDGRGNRGYIRSNWNRGPYVHRLPFGYRTVFYRERPYYVYQNTYYVSEPQGYVVVEPPVPVTVPVVTIPAPALPESAPIDAYEIYIPNPNGSFTLVTVHKTAKGFVGPQGEIYPEHPTVEQLKAMYAKK